MKRLSDFVAPTYAETHDIPPNAGCCGPVALIGLVGKIIGHKIKRK